MDGNELAQALADRFRRMIPEGFEVWEEDGRVWYSAGFSSYWGGGRTGSFVRLNFDNDNGPVEARIQRIAEDTLNELQDFIDEESTEPWPGTRTVPRAQAEIRDGQLFLWFDDSGVVMLESEPIVL
jgi:limonene-1,2-epoxide hydrolase